MPFSSWLQPRQASQQLRGNAEARGSSAEMVQHQGFLYNSHVVQGGAADAAGAALPETDEDAQPGPVFVPIVLSMNEADHAPLLEEWLARQQVPSFNIQKKVCWMRLCLYPNMDEADPAPLLEEWLAPQQVPTCS